MKVIIGEGPFLEARTVQGFGSIVLDSPLGSGGGGRNSRVVAVVVEVVVVVVVVETNLIGILTLILS